MDTLPEKKTVILIHPSPVKIILDAVPKLVPLSILSVASTIPEEYSILLIDRAVNRNDVEFIDILKTRNVVCVGLSVLTGYSILDSIHCSKLIRETTPNIPIVWGGWHASADPQSILEKEYVDFVVKGEAEVTFPELLQTLSGQSNNLEIPGVCYRDGHNYVVQPPLPPLELDELPYLPFHLLGDMRPYYFFNFVPEGGNCLELETSRGCPYGCTFCEISNQFGSNYKFLSPERMVEQIRTLKETYGIGGIKFQDANLFLSIKRIRKFAQLLIDQNIDIKWGGDGTIMQFKNISFEDLELFQKSGLRVVTFGIESGNEEFRYQIQKKFTNEDVYRVQDHFFKLGMQFRFNMIVGFPGESFEQSVETVDFTVDLLSRNPQMSISTGISFYLPIPGTPMSLEAEKLGYVFPRTLEEHGQLSFFTGSNSRVWLSKSEANKLSTISHISRFLNHPKNQIPLKGLGRIAFLILRNYVIFRFRNHMFSVTLDLLFLRKVLP